MNIFHALILGLIEGATEFLPISSTGHLVIASRLMGLATTDFLKTFEIVIQFAAVLAVIILYWKRILQNKTLFLKLIIAFIPTVIVGFFVYPLIKGFLLASILTVGWTLMVGGLVIILFEKFYNKRSGELKYLSAFWIGLFQVLAFVPGVSRSGATIIGGEVLGLSRVNAVEFSFMLAIPTMVAASGYDLYKNIGIISVNDNLSLLLAGCIMAFISAFVSIKLFLGYLKTNSLSVFGWYRIVVGLVILVLYS